jgi:protein TonB
MKGAVTVRFAIFAVVAALHLVLILFFVVQVKGGALAGEEPVPVMKILDLQEEVPPPPPPPPPPVPTTDNPAAVETIAENMIETDEVPEDQVLVPPGSIVTPGVPRQGGGGEEYLSMGSISVPPVFSEQDIRRNLVYPSIARRSGLEGLVYLELFIDSRGQVQRINILRENPPNRGFGEAAMTAFRDLSCKPAEANGRPVAVRYRYPVRFRLRD